MKTSLLPLLFLGCLVAPGLAAGETSDAGDKAGADTAELSRKLDELVRNAIDEGLLEAAEPEAGEPGEPSPASPGETQVPAPAAAAGPAADAPGTCGDTDPLDFTGFEDVRQYEHIYAFRDALSEAGEDATRAARANLVKAYIALGLNSEALKTLGTPGDAASRARAHLARLMQERHGADPGPFRALADCHPSAEIWLATALLASDEAEGAALMGANTDTFRGLPLQLRIQVAAVAVPALDRLGEPLLAQKLMAAFAEAEIEESARLQFLEAQMQMQRGSREAETAMRAFLSEPAFRDEAFTAMMRNARPVEDTYRHIVLDELVQSIARAGNDREMAERLEFALREFSARSRYRPMIELAEVPALQSEPAQTLIGDHLVPALRRDLTSEAAGQTLAALHALAGPTGILEARPERAGLYAAATRQAARFGFARLAERFLRSAGDDAAAAEAFARLAHRRGERDTVYALADRHADSQPINRLAALSAIAERDAARLRVFEARLSPEPDTVLALIEADAANNAWIVSSAIYRAAKALADEAGTERVKRVFAMRRAAQEDEAIAASLQVTSLSERLSRAGATLDAMNTELR